MKSDLSNLRVIMVLPGTELFGNERDNIEACLALRELGAKILVGTNKNLTNNDIEKYLQKLKFETFNIPFGNQWSWMWLKKYPLSIFEKINQLWRCSFILSRQIRKFKPTYVHIGSLLAYNYIAPVLIFNKVKLLYRMGDAPPTNSKYNMLVWHFAVKRSSRVIAVSDFIKQQIFSQGIANCKVEKLYNLAPSRLSCKEVENVKREGLVFVGRLAESKGLWPLLQASARLKPLMLNIVGGSRYSTKFRDQLQEWVKSHDLQDTIHFLGQLDDPTVYYAQALVHIAPSIAVEGLGMVVLEAKKAGTPSIVFPSGGLTEMVRHGIDGYICHDKTLEALVEAIEWMFSDCDRLLRMGESARKDYETRFGRDRFLLEWAQIYSGACKHTTVS